MFRIASLVAVTLLLITASGTKADTGASPSSAPSATVPDKASCDAAMAVFLIANGRLIGAVFAIELASDDPAKQEATLKKFGEGMTIVVTGIDEALGKTAHPEVKAVIKEYQNLTNEVQASFATNAHDIAGLVTKLESVAERMEKTGERFDKLCATVSPWPQATPGSEREALCLESAKVEAGLVDAVFEASRTIKKPGSTRAEIDQAVATMAEKFDAAITKTKQLSAKATDSQLSTVFNSRAAELESVKQQILAVAKDTKKLRAYFEEGPTWDGPTGEKLNVLCDLN